MDSEHRCMYCFERIDQLGWFDDETWCSVPCREATEEWERDNP